MEFSWNIHRPNNKDGPPAYSGNKLSVAPQNDSGAMIEVEATVNRPLNTNSSIISPGLLMSTSTEDESTTLQSRSLCSSSHNDDNTSMEILDAPLGDFSDIVNWTLGNDKAGNSPTYLVPCESSNPGLRAADRRRGIDVLIYL